MCCRSVHYRMWYAYVTKQHTHIYKYFQSHIITLHQRVSVSAVTIFGVAYYNNTINIKIKNIKQSHYRPGQALRFPGG